MQTKISARGDSAEQQACEALIIAGIGQSLGCTLTKQPIPLPSGGHLEIDGCSADRRVFCEAWAHQGAPKSAQKGKVMTDAARLFSRG
jgi:hypothetical protein